MRRSIDGGVGKEWGPIQVLWGKSPSERLKGLNYPMPVVDMKRGKVSLFFFQFGCNTTKARCAYTVLYTTTPNVNLQQLQTASKKYRCMGVFIPTAAEHQRYTSSWLTKCIFVPMTSRAARASSHEY